MTARRENATSASRQFGFYLRDGERTLEELVADINHALAAPQSREYETRIN